MLMPVYRTSLHALLGRASVQIMSDLWSLTGGKSSICGSLLSFVGVALQEHAEALLYDLTNHRSTSAALTQRLAARDSQVVSLQVKRMSGFFQRNCST